MKIEGSSQDIEKDSLSDRFWVHGLIWKSKKKNVFTLNWNSDWIGKTSKWLGVHNGSVGWKRCNTNVWKNTQATGETRGFQSSETKPLLQINSPLLLLPKYQRLSLFTTFLHRPTRSLAFYFGWSSTGLIWQLLQIHTPAKQLSQLIAFIVRANMSLSKCHWAVPMDQILPEGTYFRGCPSILTALILMASYCLLSNIRHSIKGLILYSRR